MFRKIASLSVWIGLTSIVGCAQPPDRPMSRLSVPAPDRLRIVYTQVASGDDRIHAKWSVIGGKNWETPVAEGPLLRLTGGYPLNSPMRSGGCHTWEFDLQAERVSGKWKWNAVAHGSNGKTARSEGTAERIELRLESDSEERIPARLNVARIDDQALTLEIPG